jgi:hypothetical protein
VKAWLIAFVFYCACLWTTAILAQHYWQVPPWPSALIAVVWLIGGSVLGYYTARLRYV